jgi:hypothetical protein
LGEVDSQAAAAHSNSHHQNSSTAQDAIWSAKKRSLPLLLACDNLLLRIDLNYTTPKSAAGR